MARMREYHVPGVALGVLQDDKTTIRGFGVTSVDDPLPVTADTAFPLASISKTVTATAMMRLVEQGRVDLRAPVRKYLPDFRVLDEAASRDATIWHLLTHTSGWEGQLSAVERGDETLARFVAQLSTDMQLAPPGAAWSYNNAGFGVAGRVIELSPAPHSARRSTQSRDRATDAEKRTRSSRIRGGCGTFRPSSRPNCLPHGRVLAVYHRPYDPKRPVVCLDESSKQLIGETRKPLPPRPAHETAGQVERYDQSTCATASPTCSWPASRSADGGTSRSPSIVAVRTGRASCAPWWTGATRGREGRAGHGPAQHPLPRHFLRNVPTRDAKRLAERLDSSHAQAWLMAEHRRDRAECSRPRC